MRKMRSGNNNLTVSDTASVSDVEKLYFSEKAAIESRFFLIVASKFIIQNSYKTWVI